MTRTKRWKNHKNYWKPISQEKETEKRLKKKAYHQEYDKKRYEIPEVKAKMIKVSTLWRRDNKEKSKEYFKKWYAQNKEKHNKQVLSNYYKNKKRRDKEDDKNTSNPKENKKL